MTESMKFGPEWLRNMSNDMGGSGGGGGGSSSNCNNNSSSSAASLGPRYPLAEYRYGREEMLSLFDKNLKVPEVLPSFKTLYVDKVQCPLALTPSTEDEVLNSAQRPWGLRSPISFGISSRGTGRGGSVDRGRGSRPRGLFHMNMGGYLRPTALYDEEIRAAGKTERGWPERNGANEVQSPDWNGSPSSSPRKEYNPYARGTMENWRRNRPLEDDGTNDGWRGGASNSGTNCTYRWSRSSSWRDDDNNSMVTNFNTGIENNTANVVGQMTRSFSSSGGGGGGGGGSASSSSLLERSTSCTSSMNIGLNKSSSANLGNHQSEGLLNNSNDSSNSSNSNNNCGSSSNNNNNNNNNNSTTSGPGGISAPNSNNNNNDDCDLNMNGNHSNNNNSNNTIKNSSNSNSSSSIGSNNNISSGGSVNSSSRNSSSKSMGNIITINSQQWEQEDLLPEWATENPTEAGGSFDATGAFHGPNEDNQDDDNNCIKEKDIICKEDKRKISANSSSSNFDNTGKQNEIISSDHVGFENVKNKRDDIISITTQKDITSKEVIKMKSSSINKDEKLREMQQQKHLLIDSENLQQSTQEQTELQQVRNQKQALLQQQQQQRQQRETISQQKSQQQQHQKLQGHKNSMEPKNFEKIPETSNLNNSKSSILLDSQNHQIMSLNSNKPLFSEISDRMQEVADDMVEKLIMDDELMTNTTIILNKKTSASSAASLPSAPVVASNVPILKSNPVTNSSEAASSILQPPLVSSHHHQLMAQSQPPPSSNELWFYRDPQGKVQGPFTATEMAEWYRAGYFDENLYVRRFCDQRYAALGELVKMCGNGMPFLSSHLIPPLLPEMPVSQITHVTPGVPTAPGGAATQAGQPNQPNSQPQQQQPSINLKQNVPRNQFLGTSDMMSSLNLQLQFLQKQFLMRQQSSILNKLAATEPWALLNPEQQQQLLNQQMQQVVLPDHLMSLSALTNSLSMVNPSTFALQHMLTTTKGGDLNPSKAPTGPTPPLHNPLSYGAADYGTNPAAAIHNLMQTNTIQPQSALAQGPLQHPAVTAAAAATAMENDPIKSLLLQLQMQKTIPSAGTVPAPGTNSAASAPPSVPPTLANKWTPNPIPMQPSGWGAPNTGNISAPPMSMWDFGPIPQSNKPEMKTEQQILEEQLQKEKIRQNETSKSNERDNETATTLDSNIQHKQQRLHQQQQQQQQHQQIQQKQNQVPLNVSQQHQLTQQQQQQHSKEKPSEKGKSASDEKPQKSGGKHEEQQDQKGKSKNKQQDKKDNKKSEEDRKKELAEEKRRHKEERKRQQQLEEEKRRIQQEEEKRRQMLEEKKRQEEIDQHRKAKILENSAPPMNQNNINSSNNSSSNLANSSSSSNIMNAVKSGKGNSFESRSLVSSVAPWVNTGLPGITTPGPNFAEIQKAERERRAEEQRLEQFLENQRKTQQMELLAQKENTLKWNSQSLKALNVKSLVEIQAEEAKRLASEQAAAASLQHKKKEELASSQTTSSAFGSHAAGSAFGSIWNTRGTQNIAWNGKAWSTSTSGFWEEPSITNSSGGMITNAGGGKQQQQLQQQQQQQPTQNSRILSKSQTISNMQSTAKNDNAIINNSNNMNNIIGGNLSSSTSAKQNINKSNNMGNKTGNQSSSNKKNSSSSSSSSSNQNNNNSKKDDPRNEFTSWCIKTLSAMNSSVDVPTFISFLQDIESPFEVKDYVRSYVGETKECTEFVKQFLERRSKYKNQLRAQKAHIDDMCSPAPAINPAANDFQEVKGKGKKVKKNKMTKLDARILGFSVTAAQDRLNVGDRDYGDNS